MNDQTLAALVGLGVYFGMRLLDALIPRGRHFKFIDKWTTKDDESDDG